MKKCDFLSPEALLQAEIFGNGSGGGNSGVTDVSSSISVYTGGRSSATTIKAFWDSANGGGGLYYVKFLRQGDLPSISTIDNSIVSISPLFLSSNESATYDSETGEISFSDTTTGENIETYGILYPGSVGQIK